MTIISFLWIDTSIITLEFKLKTIFWVVFKPQFHAFMFNKERDGVRLTYVWFRGNTDIQELLIQNLDFSCSGCLLFHIPYFPFPVAVVATNSIFWFFRPLQLWVCRVLAFLHSANWGSSQDRILEKWEPHPVSFQVYFFQPWLPSSICLFFISI